MSSHAPDAHRPCLTALDLGSHRFRSLRRGGSATVGRASRAAYGTLPDSPARRALLEQVGLAYAVAGGGGEDASELVLIGDAADEYARLFGTPALPLLHHGAVPTDDPPARQLIGTLIDGLLPDPLAPGEPVNVVYPGGPAERRFLSGVIKLRGYEPIAVDPAEAFAAAAMGSVGLRGVALVCGAERWDLAVILNGRCVARCTAEGGAAALDARRAEDRERIVYEEDGRRLLDVEGCRRDRETFRGTLAEPGGEEEEAIAELHAAALAELFAEAADRFAGVPALRNVGKPLPLVVGGGGRPRPRLHRPGQRDRRERRPAGPDRRGDDGRRQRLPDLPRRPDPRRDRKRRIPRRPPQSGVTAH